MSKRLRLMVGWKTIQVWLDGEVLIKVRWRDIKVLRCEMLGQARGAHLEAATHEIPKPSMTYVCEEDGPPMTSSGRSMCSGSAEMPVPAEFDWDHMRWQPRFASDRKGPGLQVYPFSEGHPPIEESP